MKTAMKRLLSLLLALTMVLSMVPTAALAAEIEETESPLVTEPVETTAPPEATEPPATEAETEAPTTEATEAEVIETEAVWTEPTETEAPVVEVEQITANAPVAYVVADYLERDILLPRVDMNLDQLPGDEHRFIDTEDALIDDGIKCIRNYIGKTDPNGGYVDEVPGDYKGFDGQYLAAVLEFEGIAENGVLTIFDENTTVVINGTRCPTELLDEGTRIRATYVYQLQTIPVFYAYLNIPAPVAGEKPVYAAEYASETGGRYELGAAEGQKTINNVRWIDGFSDTEMAEGDVFKSGHWYKALIYIKAGVGCKFDESITATVNGQSDIYTAPYYKAGTNEKYDPEQYRVVVMDFYPMTGEYEIYVENGYAYNADGEKIGSAKPGDIVTLVAGEPPVSDMEGYENMSFEAWEVITNHEPYIFADGDDYKSTTTFVMPEGDVHIQCCFWWTNVEEVNLTLGGYGIGSYVEALTVTEDADGIELGYNGRYGTNYAIYDGPKGTPNSMLPIRTVIEAGEVYWLKVTLNPVPGYSLDLLAWEYPENIKLNGTSANEVYYNNDGSLEVAFLLPAAEAAEAHTITVIDGYAEVGPSTATSAIAGSKVYLYGIAPDDKAENHGFSHWEVVKGNVVFDSEGGYTSFTMPDEDVELKAVYLPYVFDVYLTITEPAGGQKPDFAPQTVTKGITIGEVRWSEIAATHEVPLGKDDTFGYNTGYRVEIDVYRDDAHIFSESPYGYINEEYAEAYPDCKCLTLGYYFEVPAQQFTITVNGGKVTTADGRTITTAAEGDRVFIEAVAPEDHIFDHWEVVKGDVQILWPEAYTNDFFMPAEDVEVKAVFTSMKDIPIMIVDGNGGDLNPSYDCSVNNRIDMLVRKGQSSYYDQEGDVTWTTSSATIATVERAADKNYWELVFHKPGTVTITAKDAYGCKDTVKITAYYLTDGKLTATCDAPEIGLQVGQWATMSVFGSDKETPIDTGKLYYSVSQGGIVTIDHGRICGVKEGSVTVSAYLDGDPLHRKASVKIKVIDPQTEYINLVYSTIVDFNNQEVTPEIEPQDDYTAVYVDSEDFTDGNGTFTLTPHAMDINQRPIQLTKSSFKWTSSNTKVATVKVNADGTATVTIKKKASGITRITLTSNDKAKKEQIFLLHVRDYTPRLSTTKVTLDYWKEDSFVPLELTEAYGNTIETVTVHEYNSKLKDFNTAESKNFVVHSNAETNTYSIGLTDTATLTKGTHKLSMKVTCANGKTYSFLISAAIQNKQPKFTLVQFNPLNIFYNDCSAQLGSTFTLDGDTPLLEKLELSENNQNKDLTLVNGNTLVLTEECINRRDYNIDLNIVLKVKLFGYKPFDMNLKVKTERKYPFLVTDPGVLLITQANKNGTLKFKILDRDTGENYSSYFGREEGSSCVNNGTYLTVWKYDNGTPSDRSDDYLTVKLTEDFFSFGEYRADIYAYKDNLMWGPLYFEVTVKYVKELPKVSLSEKALNLNSTFTQRTSVAQVSISDYTLNLSDLKLNFACTDKGGSAAFEQAQKISLTYQPGYGVVAAFKDQNDLPTAGSYTFAAIPEVNGVTLPKVSIKVSVKDDTNKLSIDHSTVKLNKYLAGSEVFSTDCFYGSSDLQLLGFKEAGNAYVNISYSDGQLHAKLKRADAAAKYTFQLTPKVKDLTTGQIVYSPNKLKLTVQTYKNEKLAITMASTGKLDTIVPDSAMFFYVKKVTNAAATPKFLRLEGADAERFNISLNEYNEVVLTLKKDQTYSTKQAYQIKFVYEVCGKEVTSAVMKIKVTQSKVKASILPATTALYLNSRLSKVKILNFTIKLTTPDGAKLDAGSIKLNTSKTTLAMRRALGSANVQISEDGTTAKVSILVKNPGLLDSGKKYSIAFDVAPVGNASNVKPVTVTAAVLAK